MMLFLTNTSYVPLSEHMINTLGKRNFHHNRHNLFQTKHQICTSQLNHAFGAVMILWPLTVEDSSLTLSTQKSNNTL